MHSLSRKDPKSKIHNNFQASFSYRINYQLKGPQKTECGLRKSLHVLFCSLIHHLQPKIFYRIKMSCFITNQDLLKLILFKTCMGFYKASKSNYNKKRAIKYYNFQSLIITSNILSLYNLFFQNTCRTSNDFAKDLKQKEKSLEKQLHTQYSGGRIFRLYVDAMLMQ